MRFFITVAAVSKMFSYFLLKVLQHVQGMEMGNCKWVRPQITGSECSSIGRIIKYVVGLSGTGEHST